MDNFLCECALRTKKHRINTPFSTKPTLYLTLRISYAAKSAALSRVMSLILILSFHVFMYKKKALASTFFRSKKFKVLL